jgi:hypothetical protein
MSDLSVIEPEKIEKTKIIELIKSESQDISYEVVSGKNPKWKEFNRILNKQQKTDFIICLKCKDVLTHKKFTETTPIASHKCKIIGNQTKIEHLFPKKATNINAIKSERTDAVVKCCALNLRSFSLIEGEGFKLLAQKLINIGARYGLLKVDEVLPTCHTVSNRVPKTYDEV